MELTALWQGAPEYRALRQGLAGDAAEQLVVGLQGSERAYLAAALLRDRGGAALWLAPSPAQAERIHRDLAALLPEREVLYYPEREVLPFEVVAESTERVAQRVRVHARLLLGEPLIVVAPLEAALGRLTPPHCVRAAMLTLRPGQRVDLRALSQSLVRLGYVREERVDAPGQFAVRGSIVDVFGLGEYVRVQNGAAWSRLGPRWDTDTFPRLRVRVYTRVTITNLGTLVCPPFQRCGVPPNPV